MGNTYKAEIKMVDGRPQLIIHPIIIETVDAQGNKGVTIKVPSLNVISKFKEEIKDGIRDL